MHATRTFRSTRKLTTYDAFVSRGQRVFKNLILTDLITSRRTVTEAQPYTHNFDFPMSLKYHDFAFRTAKDAMKNKSIKIYEWFSLQAQTRWRRGQLLLPEITQEALDTVTRLVDKNNTYNRNVIFELEDGTQYEYDVVSLSYFTYNTRRMGMDQENPSKMESLPRIWDDEGWIDDDTIEFFATEFTRRFYENNLIKNMVRRELPDLVVLFPTWINNVHDQRRFNKMMKLRYEAFADSENKAAKILVLPTCVGKNHWVVFVVGTDTKDQLSIDVLDSLSDNVGESYTDELLTRRVGKTEYSDKNKNSQFVVAASLSNVVRCYLGYLKSKNENVPKWDGQVRVEKQQVMQQDDGSCCGILALLFMDHLTTSSMPKELFGNTVLAEDQLKKFIRKARNFYAYQYTVRHLI